MAKKPQTLNELRTVWYKKLELNEFKDIEKDEYYFKDTAGETSSDRFKTNSVRRNYYAKSEYYYLATHFLNDYSFKSPLESIIWEYHSNGVSIRGIVGILNKIKVLKHNKKIKPNKDNISSIIRKLAKEMKKMYSIGYK